MSNNDLLRNTQRGPHGTVTEPDPMEQLFAGWVQVFGKTSIRDEEWARVFGREPIKDNDYEAESDHIVNQGHDDENE